MVKVGDNQFLSIEQLQDRYLRQSEQTSEAVGKGQTSFQDILLGKTGQPQTAGGLKFSKHAAGRLAERKIELTDSQVERLSEGMQRAGEKGIKDSLVLVDQLAFIVNVKSGTVVTAMNQADRGENVFTNIDGAVIM